MAIQIQVRRDAAADWTSNNPTLAAGEFGYETDTGKVKIGDGTTAWTSLAYIDSSGAVLSSLFNANTILAATDDNTPAALEVGEQTVVGRITSGAIAALSVSQLKTLIGNSATGVTGLMTGAQYDKLDGIEAAADVTDATNVDAAGAVMEGDYGANSILAATTVNTPVSLEVPEQTLVGRITAGEIDALTVAEVKTLLGITTIDGGDATSF